MDEDNWVIDAAMSRDGLFCFCPVEGDIRDPLGDFTVVTGLMFLGDKPPHGQVVAMVHEDGQAAADAFYETHREAIDALLADARKFTPSPP
jgi:hypothetical protein